MPENDEDTRWYMIWCDIWSVSDVIHDMIHDLSVIYDVIYDVFLEEHCGADMGWQRESEVTFIWHNCNKYRFKNVVF